MEGKGKVEMKQASKGSDQRERIKLFSMKDAMRTKNNMRIKSWPAKRMRVRTSVLTGMPHAHASHLTRVPRGVWIVICGRAC